MGSKFILGRGYIEMWVDVKGREHDVKDMSDKHIQNVIKCFEGIGRTNLDNYLGGPKKWLPIFYKEQNRRTILKFLQG